MIRLFFDILHGIDRADIPLVTVLELAVFLGHDGQLEQNSGMETYLFGDVMEQLKDTKMTNTENALMWLYVKSWGSKAQHVLDDKSLWNFGGEDLEATIIRTSYPKKKDSTERIHDLTKLINGRFDKIDDFFTGQEQFMARLDLYLIDMIHNLFSACSFHNLISFYYWFVKIIEDMPTKAEPKEHELDESTFDESTVDGSTFDESTIDASGNWLLKN